MSDRSPNSIRVDSADLAWRDTPCAGVSWKKLRFDAATGASAVLLRFEPGAVYDTHRHPGGEQYLVLEGSLRDGDDTWGPGAYVWHPPGSVHRPRSDAGCLLFVTLPAPIEVLGVESSPEPAPGTGSGPDGRPVANDPPDNGPALAEAAARVAALAERALLHGELPERFNFARDVFDAWPAAADAMLWVDDVGTRRRISFGEFTARSESLARGLLAAGLRAGDAVIVVLPRLVEWWEVALACLRAGLVLSPGTTQLTSKDLAFRMDAADARAVIGDADAAARFDAALPQVARAPLLRVIVDGDRAGWTPYGEVCAAPGEFVAADTAPDDPALLYFTSGTTGAPKMTLHTQASYGLGHFVTGHHWLDLKPGDLHWNLSDTGWAKAAYSSLFAPWCRGATVFVHHTERFDPAATLALLEREPITTFCAAPTIYRLLVQQDLSALAVPMLRHCVGAGEPLNPEVIEVWRRATGLTIHDGYGQTETVLLVGNAPGDAVAPGSMGRPMPGFDIAVVDDAGARLPVETEGEVAVALTPRRPLGLFREYFHDAERTAAAFRGGWYRTGDRARVDAEGRFWFIGRDDDVISSSAYRIGPFEVESVLLEHPAVVESAVVGQPDPVRGQIVLAYVVLAPDYAQGRAPDDALVAELQEFVRTHTAPYKYPRRIVFVDELPKTVSGKIRRVELRARAAREA